MHFHGGDCGGFNALLCGLRLKSTEEKTVSGIITVIADGKYTLQPGTIESIENQFPGGMNDGSRRDGSALNTPTVSDEPSSEPNTTNTGSVREKTDLKYISSCLLHHRLKSLPKKQALFRIPCGLKLLITAH